MENLKGIVTQIIKEDINTKRVFLSVLEEKSNNNLEPIKVGAMGLGVRIGDFISVNGEIKEGVFRNKPTKTFQGQQIHPDIPKTKEGNRVFFEMLYENKFDINKNDISLLIEKYGNYTVKKMYDNPSLLLELLKEQKKYGQEFLNLFKDKMKPKETFDFLETTGLESKTIDKIIGIWLQDAYDKIKENPYSVIKEGVSLKEAEKIGKKLKIDLNDPRRMNALILTALEDAENRGSTYLKYEDIIKFLESYNNINIGKLKIYLYAQTNNNNQNGYKTFLSNNNGLCCSRDNYYYKEENIIKKIVEFYSLGNRHSFESVKEITDRLFDLPENKNLDIIQKTAVLLCASEPITILSGGPGTGKSTIMNLVAQIATELDDGPLFLAAPTGMASKRLSETTNRKASTIHRLLKAKEANGTTIFGMNEKNKLPDKCVIILDEASMIDIEIIDAITKAMPLSGRLILVGDPGQLQSVGPGTILKSLLELKVNENRFIPSIELKNIYRSSKNGGIALGAQEIDKGLVPTFSMNDDDEAHFVETKDEEASNHIMNLMFEKLPSQGYKPVKDITILSPQAPGSAGTWELNKKISSKINPDGKKIAGIYTNNEDHKDTPLPRVGDRVMLRENDKDNDLINGELGYIISAGKSSTGKFTITVKYDYNDIEIEYPVTKWRQLHLAYAISIHKSQGSQFPIVIIPMVSTHEMMHEKSLLKTGWSRAEKKVFLVGNKASIERCLDTNKSNERQTLIKDFFDKEVKKKITNNQKIIYWEQIINDAYLINEKNKQSNLLLEQENVTEVKKINLTTLKPVIKKLTLETIEMDTKEITKQTQEDIKPPIKKHKIKTMSFKLK